MLIRGVIDHQVHDDLDVPLSRLRDELIHILHGAKLGVDPGVIADVIAVIRVGRRIDGAEPDNAHSQVLQLIQVGDDPLQIADAIAVTVLEAAGPDLIDYPLLPPLEHLPCLLCCFFQLLHISISRSLIPP